MNTKLTIPAGTKVHKVSCGMSMKGFADDLVEEAAEGGTPLFVEVDIAECMPAVAGYIEATGATVTVSTIPVEIGGVVRNRKTLQASTAQWSLTVLAR